jgi:hypothetical protein
VLNTRHDVIMRSLTAIRNQSSCGFGWTCASSVPRPIIITRRYQFDFAGFGFGCCIWMDDWILTRWLFHLGIGRDRSRRLDTSVITPAFTDVLIAWTPLEYGLGGRHLGASFSSSRSRSRSQNKKKKKKKTSSDTGGRSRASRVRV